MTLINFLPHKVIQLHLSHYIQYIYILIFGFIMDFYCLYGKQKKSAISCSILVELT